MSKPLKPRRGTTAEQNAFVGEAYEVTYDTDKNTLVCRDGVTPGGFPLARADKQAAQDEVIAGKLDKSGGTMTGPIKHDSVDTVLRAAGDGWQTRISGGSSGWGTGGIVVCYGVGSPNVPGGVRLAAMQPGTSGFKALTLMYDLESEKWKLVWGDSDVLTSEGGTISGQLQFSATVGNIKKQNTSGRMIVRGGTDWADGGVIILGGQDDTAGYASQVYMHSGIGGSVKHRLIVDTDGVTIDGSPVLTLVASGANSNGWYRKYSDGFIIQGNFCNRPTNDYITISFPTPFTTNDRFVTKTVESSDHTNSLPADEIGIQSASATSFRTYYGHFFRWIACGY